MLPNCPSVDAVSVDVLLLVCKNSLLTELAYHLKKEREIGKKRFSISMIKENIFLRFFLLHFLKILSDIKYLSMYPICISSFVLFPFGSFAYYSVRVPLFY